MRRSLLVAVLLGLRRFLFVPTVICFLLVAIHPALGQTPPPPPGPGTPTSTPGPAPTGTPTPGAMALLQQMRSAMSAAGTVTFQLDTTVIAKARKKVELTTQGTASFPTSRFHTTTTIVRTRLDRAPQTHLSERSELEAVGTHAAWRVPRMSWQCESVPATALNTELVALELRPKSAQVLGTAAIGGIAVTRVGTRAMLYPWSGDQLDTLEVDLAHATGAPVRISATFPTTLDGRAATQTLAETYTRYGAPVQITLPRKCR